MNPGGTESGAGDAPPALDPVGRCLACGSDERTVEAEVRAQMMPAGAPEERFSFMRCGACGLVYLDPRVPTDALGRYYTEAYLPYRGPAAWGPFAPLVASGLRKTDRARVALVRRHGTPGPSTRVLDVGCGKPTFLEALVRTTGCAGIGTDFSDHGWSDDPGRWEGLDLRVGDLHELAFEAPLDVVTMWHYLEHDYAPRETLARVRELVAGSEHPGGPRLVIEVPDHDSLTRARYGSGWAGYHAPRHTALYSAGSMRTLLEESGWAPVEIRRSGTMDPYVLEWMSRMEGKGIDWSRSMAPRFPGFMAWKLIWETHFLRRKDGLGILTAVARPR